MTVHFNAPVLNRKSKGGARQWYSNLPVAVDPDYYSYYFDWTNESEYDITTADWTQIKDAGASVVTNTSTLNGAIILTSAATTENDGSSIQQFKSDIQFTSGKNLWYEAGLEVSDADQMDVWAGITVGFATNPEAVLTAAERVGFQINDGDASILAKSEDGGVETSTDTGIDAVDATNIKLGFHWDGVSRVRYYVNRKLVATHTTNIPTGDAMKLSLMELSGDATGTKSMTSDYLWVVMER